MMQMPSVMERRDIAAWYYEHIEEAGVHSGDSVCVILPFSQ